MRLVLGVGRRVPPGPGSAARARRRMAQGGGGGAALCGGVLSIGALTRRGALRHTDEYFKRDLRCKPDTPRRGEGDAELAGKLRRSHRQPRHEVPQHEAP